MGYSSLYRTFLLFLQDVTEFPANLDPGRIEVFTYAEAFRAGHNEAEYRERHRWRVPEGEDGIDSLPGTDEQPICDTFRQEAILEDGAVHEPPMVCIPYPAGVIHKITVAFHDFFIIHALP